MKINEENILSIPLDSFAKVKQREFSEWKTALLCPSSLIGLVMVIIVINSFPLDISTGLTGPI
jgi:hypothetical protein